VEKRVARSFPIRFASLYPSREAPRLFTHWIVAFRTWKIPSGLAARMAASWSFWALVSRSAFFRRIDCFIRVRISVSWGRRSPVAGTVIPVATETSWSVIFPAGFREMRMTGVPLPEERRYFTNSIPFISDTNSIPFTSGIWSYERIRS